MSINIAFYPSPQVTADTIVIFAGPDKALSPAGESLDNDLKGLISYHLQKKKKFSGKAGQTCLLTAPEDAGFDQVMIVGLGKDKTISSFETIGGKVYLALQNAGATKASVLADLPAIQNNDDGPDEGNNDESKPAPLAGQQQIIHIAAGLKLRAYKYEKYKTKDDSNEEDGDRDTLESVEFIADLDSDDQTYFEDLQHIVSGVHWARDFVNDPPNDLYPDSFANHIKEELKPLGVDVEIFDEKKMKKHGFHAALEVGKGSSRPPRIVVMRWTGESGKNDDDDAGPLAFVGKGVTFDTGGINLKPASGITEMKLDMAGAAAVVGAMKAVALRKAKTEVVGIVGLAENMPSDKAYRPSDVIKSRSGQTIEVLNTDAEGRLVLADCLSYVQDTYEPALIVDLATLTGAMMVALGFEYCGTFCNKDTLWSQMDKAAGKANEKIWRMPLAKAYKKEMDSDIADIKNLATNGRYAGACTAAAFLERFVKDGQTWAHMDIAGVAWIKSDTPLCPKPATGFGVRTLDRLVSLYEQNES